MESYEKWSLGVELALGFNVACLVALLVYLLCTRNNCRFVLPCSNAGKKEAPHYQNLISYQKRGSAEYSDSKIISTGIEIPTSIIENGEEELSD